jgi:hypothetical protein
MENEQVSRKGEHPVMAPKLLPLNAPPTPLNSVKPVTQSGAGGVLPIQDHEHISRLTAITLIVSHEHPSN